MLFVKCALFIFIIYMMDQLHSRYSLATPPLKEIQTYCNGGNHLIKRVSKLKTKNGSEVPIEQSNQVGTSNYS